MPGLIGDSFSETTFANVSAPVASVVQLQEIVTTATGEYVAASLAPGHYQATFLVTAESSVEGVEVGFVDVNGSAGATPVPTLAAAPLKAARGEQIIKLTFDANNPQIKYEFRVFLNGKGIRTTVKGVQVAKL